MASNNQQQESDDFFFTQTAMSPPKQTASLGGRAGTSSGKSAPPPPPPRARPRPTTARRPVGQQQQQQPQQSQQQSLLKPGTSQRTATRNPSRPAYYSGNANGQSTTAAAAPGASNAPTGSYYGGGGVSGMAQATAPGVSSTSGSTFGGSYYGGSAAPSPVATDWSAPKAGGTNTGNDWFTPGAPAPAISAAPGITSTGFMVPQSQSSLQGSMDNKAPAATSNMTSLPNNSSFSDFSGSNNMVMASADSQDTLSNMNFENEPPLLEELGIHLDQILLKTKTVLLPFRRDKDHVGNVIGKDADLAGPLAFGLLLGGEMVLTGKLQFGYIYGFGLFGCVSMTLILNLLSPNEPISIWTVTSVLGYSLLPVNVLAILKIFLVSLLKLHFLGRLLGLLAVAWSTAASTRLLELGCGLRPQRYLVAYPIALLYSAFVLITIF